MHNLDFYIVDVFAEEKYAGNQLAVITCAGALSTAEMQRIAQEMNYSETAFILSDEQRDGAYDVRIFTPEEEVPFAGHPTLGTAYVIQHQVLAQQAERVILNLKAGRIPVTEVNGVLWMRQFPPDFGEVLDPSTAAQVLTLEDEDLDARYPVQEVSTGLSTIIVPLRGLKSLKKSRVDREKYFELIAGLDARTILAFTPEPYASSNDLSVRVFADYYGVPEDPATGSAAGCLAGYLVRHGYFDADCIDIRVEQGYEVGRPSLLYLHAEKSEGEISVSVGGKVQMVARGELL